MLHILEAPSQRQEGNWKDDGNVAKRISFKPMDDIGRGFNGSENRK